MEETQLILCFFRFCQEAEISDVVDKEIGGTERK
jgi:hypothetical protein